jgi:hypothetical protein
VVVGRKVDGSCMVVESVGVEFGTIWSWLGVMLELEDMFGVVVGEVVEPSVVLRFL